jgi:hypothetical protein
VAFWFAVTACLIAAVSSLLTDRVGRKHPAPDWPAESLGSELAAVAGEGALSLSELVVPDEPPR